MTRRLLVLALVALGGLVACQERPSIDAPAVEQASAAASTDVLAALEAAQALHHRADVLLRDGTPTATRAAIDEITKVLAVRFPAGAPEADAVQLDARARLGKLYLSLADLDAAERVTQDGLTDAARDSFYLANLYNVRGEIHEARAATLDDKTAANVELRRAIEAYAHGQDINVRVQARVYHRVEQETQP
jgi:hypothetical protein